MTAKTMPKSRKRIFWQWVAAVFFLVVAVGLVLPARVVIVRNTEIDANQATVFALINDLHQMQQWSPKSDGDPNTQIIYSGPARGVAASLLWNGQIVGQGKQTITKSVPFSYVATRIELAGGVEMHSFFQLEESDVGTQLAWSIERDFGRNIAGRYFGLLLENIIGTDQESDLSRLRELAATLPRADFSELVIEHILVDALDVAYLSATSPPTPADISEAMGDAYFEVLGFMDRNKLASAGAPLSITRSFTGSELVFDAAIPVRGLMSDIGANGDAVKLGKTYAGTVIRVGHVGPYRLLGNTHDKIAAYIAATGLIRDGDAWESYVSDPTRTAESELLTYVYYPIRQ